MAQMMSQNEQFLRQQMNRTREEVARAQAQVVHYDSKLQTWAEQSSVESKGTPEYINKMEGYTLKKNEAAALLEAKQQEVPQLEEAIRRQVVTDTMLAAQQQVTPPPAAPAPDTRQRLRAPVPAKPSFDGLDLSKTDKFVKKAEKYLRTYVEDGYWPAPAEQVEALMELLVDDSPADKWAHSVSASTAEEFLSSLATFFTDPLSWESLSSALLSVQWRGSLRQLMADLQAANLALPKDKRQDVDWLKTFVLRSIPKDLKPKVRAALKAATDETALWGEVANLAGPQTAGRDNDAMDIGAIQNRQNGARRRDDGNGGAGGNPRRPGGNGGGQRWRSGSRDRRPGDDGNGQEWRSGSRPGGNGGGQRGRPPGICWEFRDHGRCNRQECRFSHAHPNERAPSRDNARGGGTSSH